MKIAIISDTHSLLRDEVMEKIKDCDIILHGGDIASKETVEAIEKLGRAYFVRGNADNGYKDSLTDLNPHPLVVKMLYSQPTLSQRIDVIEKIETEAANGN